MREAWAFSSRRRNSGGRARSDFATHAMSRFCPRPAATSPAKKGHLTSPVPTLSPWAPKSRPPFSVASCRTNGCRRHRPLTMPGRLFVTVPRKPKLSRRHTLSSLVLSCLSTIPLPTAALQRNPAADLLPHVDAARLIGQRYLQFAPEERSETRLREAVFGAPHSGQAASTTERLRQLIDERRRHDFATGNTVILDGWLLARTEARLCALATLT